MKKVISRNQKLKLNSYFSLLNQVIIIVSGFILPKLILDRYGSDINGLVSSITQFIGFISLMELGIGAVVQSSLFEPLAKNDNIRVNQILTSAKRFFNKICSVFIIYIVFLMIFLSFRFNDNYSMLYTMTLIVILSIGSFAQYYFGIVNQLLINADQKAYIQLILSIISYIINLLLCCLLIKFTNVGIHVLKLTTSLVFLLKPVGLYFYVKKNYKINLYEKYSVEPIRQKWNGLAQHIATTVLNNTDVVVLTIFSNLKNVSIYSIYVLVINGVKNLTHSTVLGYQAMFGNMIANNEKELINKEFSSMEWKMHTIVTLVFTCTAILIVPFVQVYTKNIIDANYIQPLFGFIMTFAQAAYCIRLPYNIMVMAAGHYKETQLSAIIEMLINIIISVVLVIKFGLIGVSIGTLVAMTYRSIYLAWYLSHNIINRSFNHFLKHVFVDLLTMAVIMLSTSFFVMGCSSYIEWIILACTITVYSILVSIIMNSIFYRSFLFSILKKKRRY